MGNSEMSKVSYTALAAPMQYLSGEVRYKHLRLQVWDERMYEKTYNKGGITIAYRYLTGDETERAIGLDIQPAILVGFAGCSWADNFDRKLGREIASKRLEKSQVVITGERTIKRLMTATDPMHVADILVEPMAAQGLRLGLCA